MHERCFELVVQARSASACERQGYGIAARTTARLRACGVPHENQPEEDKTVCILGVGFGF
jgi:hypothetical protein